MIKSTCVDTLGHLMIPLAALELIVAENVLPKYSLDEFPSLVFFLGLLSLRHRVLLLWAEERSL